MMAKMDDRMEMIGSAILSQAQKESKELIDKANDLHKQEMSDFEANIIEKMFDSVQSQSSGIRLEAAKSLARVQLDAHRTLLKHREQRAESVFENVRKRLAEYTSTPEYREKMLEIARKLKGCYDHSKSVVLVRQDDLELGGDIKEALGGSAAVKADRAIRVGGFKIKNTAAGILIDETLDERLEEHKLWFLQNCGLKIM